MEQIGCNKTVTSSYVMGACGHFLCGGCAESIFKTARENRGTNDYGPEALVNRPFCPLCRLPWDMNDRPLIVPSDPALDYVAQSDGLFLKPPSSSLNWGKSNPMLLTLKRLLISIELEEREALYKPKIVVVCSSSDLAQHIYENFRADDLHLKHVRRRRKKDRKARHVTSVRVVSKGTLASKGEALKQFQSEITEVNRMIIPAALLRGLVFDHATHFVVVTRLPRIEREIVMRTVRDASVVRGEKCKLHLLQLPNLHGNTVEKDYDCEFSLPSTPTSCEEYLMTFKGVFERPQRHTLVV
tara:strand:- start:494 stop:1390 length:897 start_codon:yes stop_codon:yes gene_type:complete